MGLPIFHSQYTAAQIEASIGKTPRIKSSTRTWEIWDIATSAYVDTGVSIDTQLFVDSTLTEAGYAADAKVTGDKLDESKSVLNYLFRKTIDHTSELVSGYITTNQAVGATVPTTIVSASNWRCGIFPCRKGDVFKITGQGGTSPRTWAFTDTNYKMLSKSAGSEKATNLEKTATQDGYFFFNSEAAKNPSVTQTAYIIPVDTTLSEAGVPADAKVVGDVRSIMTGIDRGMIFGDSAVMVNEITTPYSQAKVPSATDSRTLGVELTNHTIKLDGTTPSGKAVMVKISGTPTRTFNTATVDAFGTPIALDPAHEYLAKLRRKDGASFTGVGLSVYSAGTHTTIGTASSSNNIVYRYFTPTVTNNHLVIFVSSGTVLDNVEFWFEVIDLTIARQEIATISQSDDYDLLSATKFSADFSYSAGNKVNYNGSIYKFIASHTGAWSDNDAVYVEAAKDHGLLEYTPDGILNAYPDGGVFVGDGSTRTVYKKVYPGAQYVITRQYKSLRFRVYCTTAIPALGVAYTTLATNDSATSLVVSPPVGAKYLCVYCSTSSSSEPASRDDIANGIRFVAVCDGDVAAMTSMENSGILALNKGNYAKADILSKQRTPGSSELFQRSPLKMLFFTDVHLGATGDASTTVKRMERAVELLNGWGSGLIDVAINAGDTTSTIYNATQLAQYDSIVSESTIPVLNTVGNHDAYSTLEGARPLVEQTTVYNAITAKVKENVPTIVQPQEAATNGLNYYYYDKGDFRIVVLDCMYWDAAELSWFESVLADAITNAKAVIGVAHYNFVSTAVDYVENCVWNPIGYGVGGSASYPMPITAAEAVKTFQDNGGTFVIWLCGHSHGDSIKKLKAEYGNQFQLICPSFANRAGTVFKSSDQNCYTFDCLTYLTVDTYYHTIKGLRIGANIGCTGLEYHTFSINYETEEFLGSC